MNGSKAYCILGFRVPTTSVGARGERAKRSKGSKAYCLLGFREQRGQREQRGVKGGEGSEGERRGAKLILY